MGERVRTEGAAWLRVLLILGTALPCAACTMTRQFTHAPDPFPGIATYYEEEARTVSLLFVHGMGGFSSPNLGPKEDPLPALEFIAHELGLSLVGAPRLKLEHAWRGYVDQWELRRREDGSVAMRAYALHWKDTTRHLTDALRAADTVPPLDCARPPVTATVKDRMNDALGDVVLYAGSYRRTIQDTVIEAIQRVDANEARHATGRRTIIPVTWSLGSRILLDTLARMREDEACACAELVDSVPVVYMLANQVRFLALANETALDRDAPDPDPSGRGGARVVRLDTRGLQREDRSRTWVVGVTDPSDLLSWPLPPSEEGSSVVLVNVYHTAAQSGLWIPTAGTLGNPYSAHTDYGADPHVLGYLLRGHRPAAGCPAPRRPGY